MIITTQSDNNGLFSFDECIVQDSSITSNSAVVSITNSKFINSNIAVNSGTVINVNGTVQFINTSAGGAITLTSSTIVFSSLSNVTFCNNNAAYGGAILTISATIVFSPLSYVTFLNNSAIYGGAIYISSATIVFSPLSYVTFLNNSATYGGAIYMEYESFFNYSSPTNVTFINNTASQTGGAIHVMTSQAYHMLCFYQYSISKDSIADIYIYFESNFAREAGNAIYGGDIDYCRLMYPTSCDTNACIFDRTHHFGNHDNTSSLISSDAYYICRCNIIDHCNRVTTVNKSVYPGEKIYIDFITVGQRHGVSPSDVLLYTENKATVYTFALRSINKCKSYKIPNISINGSLYLSTELSFYSGLTSVYYINISILLLHCPAGFMYDPLSSSCTCDTMLKGYVFRCSIHSGNETILQKSGNAWIGNNDEGQLSVIDPCPSDYCMKTHMINASDFNSQCNYNRVGVACGQCYPNLSMTFGTSQCKTCTNVYLLLVIPFAVMGMALIVFLMLFNFTVSSGTINGIILYAFILRVYKDVFFPTSSGTVANVLNFLSVFIAWLNLDLGIETCFYNGMNSYSKVWLQFSFLLYMVAVVAAIIVVSRLSSGV